MKKNNSNKRKDISKCPKVNLRFKNQFINDNKINEEEKNVDILTIPNHGNFGNCFAMTVDIPKTKNSNKKEVNSIIKLGILNHSFDKNIITERNAITQRSNNDKSTKYSMNNSFFITPKKLSFKK